VFSPTYVYNQINGGRDGGTTIGKALELVKDQGCATVRDFPHIRDATRQPDARVRSRARPFRIKSYRPIPKEPESIKGQLARGRPVVIGAYVDQPFHGWTGGKVYKTYSGKPLGKHAMVVVGYDDTKGGGAFKLMNSWGVGWGDKGFCWVSYGALRSMIGVAYVATDVVGGAAPHPPPDGDAEPIMAFTGVNVQFPPPFPPRAMRIAVLGQMTNCRGRRLCLMTRFYQAIPLRRPIGPPVFVFGQALRAQARTREISIPNARFRSDAVPMVIPLQNFGFRPTRWRMIYWVGFDVWVYLDGKLVSRSRPKFISFRW
jgi:hypothetical protein